MRRASTGRGVASATPTAASPSVASVAPAAAAGRSQMASAQPTSDTVATKPTAARPAAAAHATHGHAASAAAGASHPSSSPSVATANGIAGPAAPASGSWPCAFCSGAIDSTGEKDVVWVGPYAVEGKGEMYAHGSCAKWNGEVRVAAVSGAFSVRQVQRAMARIDSSTCNKCKRKGGTIGCYASKCTRTYHCACARQSNCAFVGNFVAVYCAQHAHLKDTHQGTDLVFNVEKIRASRIRGDKKQYLVKWQGYDEPEDSTWEPEDSFLDSELVKQFEKAEAARRAALQRAREKEHPSVARLNKAFDKAANASKGANKKEKTSAEAETSKEQKGAAAAPAASDEARRETRGRPSPLKSKPATTDDSASVTATAATAHPASSASSAAAPPAPAASVAGTPKRGRRASAVEAEAAPEAEKSEVTRTSPAGAATRRHAELHADSMSDVAPAAAAASAATAANAAAAAARKRKRSVEGDRSPHRSAVEARAAPASASAASSAASTAAASHTTAGASPAAAATTGTPSRPLKSLRSRPMSPLVALPMPLPHAMAKKSKLAHPSVAAETVPAAAQAASAPGEDAAMTDAAAGGKSATAAGAAVATVSSPSGSSALEVRRPPALLDSPSSASAGPSSGVPSVLPSPSTAALQSMMSPASLEVTRSLIDLVRPVDAAKMKTTAQSGLRNGAAAAASSAAAPAAPTATTPATKAKAKPRTTIPHPIPAISREMTRLAIFNQPTQTPELPRRVVPRFPHDASREEGEIVEVDEEDEEEDEEEEERRVLRLRRVGSFDAEHPRFLMVRPAAAAAAAAPRAAAARLSKGHIPSPAAAAAAAAPRGNVLVLTCPTCSQQCQDALGLARHHARSHKDVPTPDVTAIRTQALKEREDANATNASVAALAVVAGSATPVRIRKRASTKAAKDCPDTAAMDVDQSGAAEHDIDFEQCDDGMDAARPSMHVPAAGRSRPSKPSRSHSGNGHGHGHPAVAIASTVSAGAKSPAKASLAQPSRAHSHSHGRTESSGTHHLLALATAVRQDSEVEQEQQNSSAAVPGAIFPGPVAASALPSPTGLALGSSGGMSLSQSDASGVSLGGMIPVPVPVLPVPPLSMPPTHELMPPPDVKMDPSSQEYSNWYWSRGPGRSPGHRSAQDMYAGGSATAAAAAAAGAGVGAGAGGGAGPRAGPTTAGAGSMSSVQSGAALHMHPGAYPLPMGHPPGGPNPSGAMHVSPMMGAQPHPAYPLGAGMHAPPLQLQQQHQQQQQQQQHPSGPDNVAIGVHGESTTSPPLNAMAPPGAYFAPYPPRGSSVTSGYGAAQNFFPPPFGQAPFFEHPGAGQAFMQHMQPFNAEFPPPPPGAHWTGFPPPPPGAAGFFAPPLNAAAMLPPTPQQLQQQQLALYALYARSSPSGVVSLFMSPPSSKPARPSTAASSPASNAGTSKSRASMHGASPRKGKRTPSLSSVVDSTANTMLAGAPITLEPAADASTSPPQPPPSTMAASAPSRSTAVDTVAPLPVKEEDDQNNSKEEQEQLEQPKKEEPEEQSEEQSEEQRDAEQRPPVAVVPPSVVSMHAGQADRDAPAGDAALLAEEKPSVSEDSSSLVAHSAPASVVDGLTVASAADVPSPSVLTTQVEGGPANKLDEAPPASSALAAAAEAAPASAPADAPADQAAPAASSGSVVTGVADTTVRSHATGVSIAGSTDRDEPSSPSPLSEADGGDASSVVPLTAHAPSNNSAISSAPTFPFPLTFDAVTRASSGSAASHTDVPSAATPTTAPNGSVDDGMAAVWSSLT